MQQIRLYNTMSRKIEDFKPRVSDRVGFYSCGPTVYHYAHLGNLLYMVQCDNLKRMFIANGYDVHHVMNITDVGHLMMVPAKIKWKRVPRAIINLCGILQSITKMNFCVIMMR